MLKAVIFDFDGVILESGDIKSKAFRTLFQNCPEHVERIAQFHRENGGLSRYEKFVVIYQNYLGQPLSKAEETRLDATFFSLIEHEILSCPFVPGALAFLAQTAAQLPLLIVSGTPDAELRNIMQQRDLIHYFRNVYGSPQSKETLLHQILAVYDWRASEVVYIGDSITDFRAADSVGIPFIGRVPEGMPNPFPVTVRWVVPDLQKLLSQWTTVVAELS